MILVLLGTQNNSFKRLLDKIEECINNGIIAEEVIVQAGHTHYTSNNMKILDFLPSDKLSVLTKNANFIITHGGVGSIVESLKLGKKVIAVPRLATYNEHVNDHQIQIVENFNKSGYIVGVNDIQNLPDAIMNIITFVPKKYENNTNNIINIISDYIDKF